MGVTDPEIHPAILGGGAAPRRRPPWRQNVANQLVPPIDARALLALNPGGRVGAAVLQRGQGVDRAGPARAGPAPRDTVVAMARAALGRAAKSSLDEGRRRTGAAASGTEPA